jgi:phage baseplate assembly protein gpV
MPPHWSSPSTTAALAETRCSPRSRRKALKSPYGPDHAALTYDHSLRQFTVNARALRPDH